MSRELSGNQTIYILAGPNGAGKTTFAQRFLPDFVKCREFLNADLIAAGLAPFAPDSQALRASQLLLQRMRELAADNVSFGFETTLAGRSYVHYILQWQRQGYRVVLLFLYLESVSLAIDRVAFRVQQGGHSIPIDTIHRRYERGLKNLFSLYLPVVNEAFIYNASMYSPQFIRQVIDGVETIHNPVAWNRIMPRKAENR